VDTPPSICLRDSAAGTAARRSIVLKMNREQLRGRWNEMRGDVQRKWGRLTQSDLDAVQGDMTALAGIVQQKYGYSVEKAEHELDRFLRKYDTDSRSIGMNAKHALTDMRYAASERPAMFALIALVVALTIAGFTLRPFSRHS
jgi:uncharacterized protein YjbJ (UPF0337 family)